jgi:predicted nucleic-acid-binding Zn-ribbon protein
MPRVEVERYISVNVGITCESCGHTYQSQATISAEQSMFDPFTGNSDLRVKLSKKLAKFNVNDYSDLPQLKCPQCGHTQSWNICGSQKEMAEKVALIPGLIAAVPLFITIVSNNFFAALILSLLIMGVVIMIAKVLLFPLVRLIYKPNGRKETPENSIFPSITY